MKVLHVSYSDNSGGASKAAYRVHSALKEIGVESFFLTIDKTTTDKNVLSYKNQNFYQSFIYKLRSSIGYRLTKMQYTQNANLHSLNILPSRIVNTINKIECDVVNLHWINHEMISIAEIERINKPLVWTLHDMWAFCGAEHYTSSERWIEGYHKANRPRGERGLDLNRFTWERKRSKWQKPKYIVAPSFWLAAQVKKSLLMQDNAIRVIPNAIDCNFWTPSTQDTSKKYFNLPIDKKLILFTSDSDIGDTRKGYDLLTKSLDDDMLVQNNALIVALGSASKMNTQNHSSRFFHIGKIGADEEMIKLYNAIDILVVPSRQDNLPNTVMEAQSCGKLVVGFRIGGLVDMIDHKVTGYLAEPYSTDDLLAGVRWALSNSNKIELREIVRASAVKNFSNKVVASKYLNLYNEINS
jgi:glycosyltransferase involved in cell wall biosynthesis